MIGAEMMRLVPEGTLHVLVEARYHRGVEVFAVVGVIPDGASVVLNTYSAESVAQDTAEAINEQLFERTALSFKAVGSMVVRSDGSVHSFHHGDRAKASSVAASLMVSRRLAIHGRARGES